VRVHLTFWPPLRSSPPPTKQYGTLEKKRFFGRPLFFFFPVFPCHFFCRVMLAAFFQIPRKRTPGLMDPFFPQPEPLIPPSLFLRCFPLHVKVLSFSFQSLRLVDTTHLEHDMDENPRSENFSHSSFCSSSRIGPSGVTFFWFPPGQIPGTGLS